MFVCQSVERLTLQTKLLVKVSELGLARKCFWIHGLEVGEMASGAAGADVATGGATVCVSGRTGR